MRILKENTAAVIIDVQEKLFPHMCEKEKLEQNLKSFIQGMNILKMPVIVTEQYTKGLGPTVPFLSEYIRHYPAIEKTAFSCCDDNAFMTALSKMRVKNVLLVGIESHVCVLQTVIDLLQNGFLPVIIEDCTSSRKINDKIIAINRMSGEGAIISSCESILFELLRFSGTEQFKAVSRLIK